MRFTVDPPDRLRTPAELARVFVVGPGERVEPAEVRREGDLLIVDRPAAGSARLRCPWPIPGFGSPVVATCSLQEDRPDPAAGPAPPHRLAVELARGLMAVAREQTAAAKRAGVTLEAGVVEELDEAWDDFVDGACGGRAGAGPTACAERAIAAACRVADAVAAARAAERLAVLRRRSVRPPASLAVRVEPVAAGAASDPAERIPQSLFGPFRSAVLPAGWPSVEPVRGTRDWSAVDAGLDRCEALGVVGEVGPLLDFSPGGLPAWLSEYAGSPPNLESLCADFVESAVGRLTGRVRTFEVCAAANVGGALGLDEPTRLGLVARTLQVARGMDEENRLFLRITRPFGDYLARGRHRLAPLQFADALARAGVGLDGVTLELAIGFGEAGTPARTLAGYERLLAGWSKLGLPLRVSLVVSAVTPVGVPPTDDPDGWRAGGSEERQAEWLRHHLPLLFATEAVVEVEWARARDAPPADARDSDHGNAPPQRFDGGGLLDAGGRPRPALDVFERCAEEFAVDPDAETRNSFDVIDDDSDDAMGDTVDFSGQG